ncbi:MAG: hypothetical protein AAFX03_09620 [Pseudomonadota bacterium]
MLDVQLSNGFETVSGSDGRERVLVREPRDLIVEVGVHLLRHRRRLSHEERSFLAYQDRIRAVDEAFRINPPFSRATITARYDEAAGWQVG